VKTYSVTMKEEPKRVSENRGLGKYEDVGLEERK
jgi:hypothetical protein